MSRPLLSELVWPFRGHSIEALAISMALGGSIASIVRQDLNLVAVAIVAVCFPAAIGRRIRTRRAEPNRASRAMSR